MIHKTAKKCFKLTTIMTLIISIVGCSTASTAPKIYDHTLRDKLEKSPETTTMLDGSVLTVTTNDKQEITLLNKLSKPLSKEDCTTESETELNFVKAIIKEKGTQFIILSTQENYKTYQNSISKLTLNYCAKEGDYYKYAIVVESIYESIGDNTGNHKVATYKDSNDTMNATKRFFAKIGMGTILIVGGILLIPVLILGFVFISIPSMIMSLFSGGN